MWRNPSPSRAGRAGLSFLACAALVPVIAGACAARTTSSAARGTSDAAAILIRSDGRAPVPSFNVRTTAGAEYGADQARTRVALVEFLSPGCMSCAAQVGGLREVQTRFGGRADVLLVDVGGATADEIDAFYRGKLRGGDHMYAPDPGLGVAEAFGVDALGTVVVTDGRGRIAYRSVEPEPDELQSAVAAALSEA